MLRLSTVLGSTFLAIVMMSGLNGCNSGAPAGQVNGNITLDGKPLPDAMITFLRVDEQGQVTNRPSVATTNSSGRYVLQYSTTQAGIDPGSYKITISTFREGYLDNEEKQIPRVAEKVPAKYNTKSELKSEIAKGTTTLDFDLKTDDGPVIQPDAPK